MRVNITGNAAATSEIENPKGITKLNHKELSDEELVRAFVEDQDEEAFNEIVNRYTDKIYRLALQITHNHSNAEEVLQEVFTKLIKKLHTLRGESKFQPGSIESQQMRASCTSELKKRNIRMK